MGIRALIGVSLAALVLAGCEGVEGRLTVSQEFILRTERGDSMAILPGQYKTEVKFDLDDAEALLEVSLDGRARSFKFRSVRETKQGPGISVLRAMADRNGQAVDFLGEVRTTLEDGPLRRGFESCRAVVWVERCYKAPKGEVQCYWEQREVPGEQWVEFFVRTTTRRIDIDLTHPNQAKVLAAFDGQQQDQERLYRERDLCRPR